MSTTKELSELKAGDQVAVEYRGSYEIHTIAKMTPSGQIVLENGRRFKDGREIGDGLASGWYHACIYAVTPAILDSIKRREIRSDIDRLLDMRILDQMSTKDLERVLAVLKKHTEEKEA